jgi:hypothetical protein
LLRPATIKYTLRITNHTETATDTGRENGISLIENFDIETKDPASLKVDREYQPYKSQFSGYSVHDAVYKPYNASLYDSNLIHIASWIESNFGSIVLLDYVDGPGFKGYAPNMKATSASPLFGSFWPKFDPGPDCSLFVYQPIGYIGYVLNTLMVRSSMRAATVWKQDDPRYSEPIANAIQTVFVPQYVPSIYYTTNWKFGAAAMAVIFLCLLCVLPSYYGFWQLGRKVTLGPIEVAGAFQAPIMAHPSVATHGEVDEFVKEIGQRQVRYGQVEGQQILAVAQPSTIKRPGYM